MNVKNSVLLADDVFHKTSACSSGLAQLAHVFPKNTWLGGVDAGRRRARLRRAIDSLDECLAKRASRLSGSARRDCARRSALRAP